MKKALRLIRDIAIVLLLIFGLRAFQSRGVVKGELPEFTITTIDGESFSASDLRGERVIVHFWASWCGVCGMMESSVDKLAANTRVIRIAVQSGDEGRVGEYLASRGLSRDLMLIDTSGALAERFGIHAYPTTLFIDEEGTIRFAEVGYMSGFGMRARDLLVRLF